MLLTYLYSSSCKSFEPAPVFIPVTVPYSLFLFFMQQKNKTEVHDIHILTLKDASYNHRGVPRMPSSSGSNL